MWLVFPKERLNYSSRYLMVGHLIVVHFRSVRRPSDAVLRVLSDVFTAKTSHKFSTNFPTASAQTLKFHKTLWNLQPEWRLFMRQEFSNRNAARLVHEVEKLGWPKPGSTI